MVNFGCSYDIESKEDKILLVPLVRYNIQLIYNVSP
jgi:hypothetical protein